MPARGAVIHVNRSLSELELRMSPWPYALACVVPVAFSSALVFAADSPQPISMSAQEFTRLTVAEQRALLVQVINRRLAHARNIYYEVAWWPEIHKLRDDGEPGELVGYGPGRRFRHWRLGDSYRMDTDMYVPRGKSPLHYCRSNFIAEAGVSRCTTTRGGNDPGSGRIDTVDDTITEGNDYAYWLDGRYPHKEMYLFRYLLDHKGEFDIKSLIDEGKVQLTVPWQPWWFEKPAGKEVLVLDPRRGFLPIRGYSRWDAPRGTNGAWGVDRFVVKESRLVGNVWMPIEIIFSRALSAMPQPHTVAVWDIRVSRIEFGTVKPADLVVPFTKGMQIVDAIKGITYRADANGNPSGKIVPLIAALPRASAAAATSAQRARTNTRKAAAAACSGLLALLIGVLVLRRWRGSAHSQ